MRIVRWSERKKNVCYHSLIYCLLSVRQPWIHCISPENKMVEFPNGLFRMTKRCLRMHSSHAIKLKTTKECLENNLYICFSWWRFLFRFDEDSKKSKSNKSDGLDVYGVGPMWVCVAWNRDGVYYFFSCIHTCQKRLRFSSTRSQFGTRSMVVVSRRLCRHIEFVLAKWFHNSSWLIWMEQTDVFGPSYEILSKNLIKTWLIFVREMLLIACRLSALCLFTIERIHCCVSRLWSETLP